MAAGVRGRCRPPSPRTCIRRPPATRSTCSRCRNNLEGVCCVEGEIMRLTPLVPAAFALFISAPSFAQEWIEFASRADRFTCNFPVQPTITETTYRSEYGADLPARVYSATQ